MSGEDMIDNRIDEVRGGISTLLSKLDGASEEAHPKVTELIRAICEKCAGDALDLSLADLGSVFDGVDPAGNENEQKILEIVADLKPLARAAADRVPSAKPDHSPSPSRSPLAPYAAR